MLSINLHFLDCFDWHLPPLGAGRALGLSPQDDRGRWASQKFEMLKTKNLCLQNLLHHFWQGIPATSQSWALQLEAGHSQH